ncbi:MAG: hypothetical protein WAV05_00295 [Anaerolineales bacterium]
MSYDAENRTENRIKIVQVTVQVTRLVQVDSPSKTIATFTYDGDGNRVMSAFDRDISSIVTTTYIGNPSVPSGQCYFEWTGSTSTMNVRDRYYYAGSTLIAMRTGSSAANYIFEDHLGSTAITTNSIGGKIAEIRYYP